MKRIVWITISYLILALPLCVHAQTTLYHLHKERSTTTGLLQLKAAGPDAESTILLSSDMKNKTSGEFLIKAFETRSGEPNITGVIPAGSTMVFNLWMKKTSYFGGIASKVKLHRNNASGPVLCVATGDMALSTTLTKHVLTCTVATDVTMTASDRLYLWVGAYMWFSPFRNSLKAELDIEGTLNDNYDSWIIISNPKITGISPSAAPVGTEVTITGLSFGLQQGISTVTLNGTAVTPTSWSDTKIVFQVPADARGGLIAVNAGGLSSNEIFLWVTPKITGISPTSGSAGTLVTITGYTFFSEGTVTFNGIAATPTSWSDTMITAPVPANASTGPVVVTVEGEASNGVTFTVSPQINSLSPSSGQVGTVVTISGYNFGSNQGTSSVTFNGISATPATWSDTTITVPVPSGASTGPVIVTVGGIQSNALTFTVTVPMPPEITSLSPSAGPVNSTITLSGTNFGATKGASAVTLNGIPLTTTTWSDTSLTALLPMDAATGPVVVTVNSQSSNSKTYTVITDTLTITYPINSSIINRPDTVVIGRLPSTGNDVGVTVNGQIAMVNGQDFAINGINLSIGENVITATMKDANGNTSTNVTIYSETQGSYVKLSSTIESSLAPMTTQLSLETSLTSPVTETSLTIDGPVPQSITAVTFPYSVTLYIPGIYLTTVTVTTSDGNIYLDKYALNAMDRVNMDALLNGKWTSVINALSSKDLNTALTYMLSTSRPSYQAMFNAVIDQLPSIMATQTEFNLISVTNDAAKYELVTIENGETYSYEVIFRKDENGLWMIEGF